MLDALAAGLRKNPFVHTTTVDGLIADVPVAEGAPRTFQTRASTTAPHRSRRRSSGSGT